MGAVMGLRQRLGVLSVLGVMLAQVVGAHAADVRTAPPNAVPNIMGTGWECQRGYRNAPVPGKSLNCVPVQIPANAELDLLGHGWQCQRGFRQDDGKCVAVRIPENAEIDLLGHGWTCKRGYRQDTGRCVPVQVPANAELDLLGHGWQCQRGFKNAGGRCVPVVVPANAELNLLGHGWQCRIGYTKAGDGCARMTAQEAAQQQALLRALAAGGGYRAYSYDVSGCGGGGCVTGTIDADGSRDVEGEIKLEDGRTVHFEGEWTGKGVVEGYDEDGNWYELEVD